MSVWNGHYACTCYHPLFVFDQFGDLERCALRAGNVHSADGWDDVLKLVATRARSRASIFERTRPLQYVPQELLARTIIEVTKKSPGCDEPGLQGGLLIPLQYYPKHKST